MAAQDVNVLAVSNADLALFQSLELDPVELAFAGGPIEEILQQISQSPAPAQNVLFAVRNHTEVIGFLVMREGAARPSWAPDETITLHHLRIDRHWRGRGLGRGAILSIARWIARYRPDTASIALAVNKNNERALSFYDLCGFERTGLQIEGRLGLQIVMIMRIDKLLAADDADDLG